MKNIKEIAEKSLAKVTLMLRKLGSIALLALALTTGFAIGYYYQFVRSSVKPSEWEKIKESESTSVAINERGELMIIDRKNGDYMVYDNEVGKLIFQLYAAETYGKSIAK